MATISECIGAASEAFGVSAKVLKSRIRGRPAVRARWAAMRLAAEHASQASTTMVGAALHRDHSTVIYGQTMAGGLLAADDDFRAKYQRASARLGGVGWRKLTPEPPSDLWDALACYACAMAKRGAAA